MNNIKTRINNIPALDYIFLKVSLFIGIMSAILAIYVVAINYRIAIDNQIERSNEILKALDASYFSMLVHENEHSLKVLIDSLNMNDIASGRSVISPLWTIAHKINLDEDYRIYLYSTINERIYSYPPTTQQEMVHGNDRPWFKLLEYNANSPTWIGPYTDLMSDHQVITLGQKILDSDGNQLGALMVDIPLEKINKALKESLENDGVVLFLQQADVNAIISSTDEKYNEDIKNNTRNFTFYDLMTDGLVVIRPLSYVKWKLGIYVPPSEFIRIIKNEFASKILLPVLMFGVAAWGGALLLVRIFRQEQRLLITKIEDISRKNSKDIVDDGIFISDPWFIKKSLYELKKLNQCYSNSQRELLLDPLTGILNRRAFNQKLVCAEKTITPSSTVLAIIDIDYFKSINDEFGHRVGDVVLCRISEILVLIFGLKHVYRIGGDEFGVILPGNIPNTTSAFDVLLSKVRESKWREYNLKVTLSIGIACGINQTENLFLEADKALYISKSNGRDCCNINII
ncbi:sensor domain-containing diguanylate cyclase [Aeromonas jandaei]|uniref:sensor domain-containing diguanylate cyclase n=1 Tax=Aeromonas jandaei TaxID=650 RepID=UPI001933166A|nr:sensor domain-containing diguanylate cyclase [Aeromonas jandaei]MBM0493208.1 diguanylate cyclase [Aeromonas jandaei]